MAKFCGLELVEAAGLCNLLTDPAQLGNVWHSNLLAYELVMSYNSGQYHSYGPKCGGIMLHQITRITTAACNESSSPLDQSEAFINQRKPAYAALADDTLLPRQHRPFNVLPSQGQEFSGTGCALHIAQFDIITQAEQRDSNSTEKCSRCI